jgi:hypothetical protein
MSEQHLVANVGGGGHNVYTRHNEIVLRFEGAVIAVDL